MGTEPLGLVTQVAVAMYGSDSFKGRRLIPYVETKARAAIAAVRDWDGQYPSIPSAPVERFGDGASGIVKDTPK